MNVSENQLAALLVGQGKGDLERAESGEDGEVNMMKSCEREVSGQAHCRGMGYFSCGRACSSCALAR